MSVVIKGIGFNSDGGGFLSLRIDGSEHDAQFVARAVAAHDDLVAALKDIRGWLERRKYSTAKIDAAIAKAAQS